MYSQFLHQLDETVTPQHPMMEEMLAWSRRSVKIPEEMELEWCRQAIWGVLARQYFGRVKKRRRKHALVNLLAGKRSVRLQGTAYPVKNLDIRQLLIEPDLTPIRQAQKAGNGVLVVGYHLGPPYPAGRILGELGFDVMTFSRSSQTRNYEPLANLENIVLTEGDNKKFALWKARDHLKKNRIVAIAGDGRVGESPVLYDLFGEKVTVNMGFAFLAEHTRAKVFFAHHQWQDDYRFQLTFHAATPSMPDPSILDPSIPDPSMPERDKPDYPAESRWVFSYLDHFKDLITNQPRLITFSGGLWKQHEGGIKWRS